MIVDRYYYHQLNKEEQAIYKAFYNGVMAHEDIIPVPVCGELDEDKFERIFAAMTRDNAAQRNCRRDSPKKMVSLCFRTSFGILTSIFVHL